MTQQTAPPVTLKHVVNMAEQTIGNLKVAATKCGIVGQCPSMHDDTSFMAALADRADEDVLAARILVLACMDKAKAVMRAASDVELAGTGQHALSDEKKQHVRWLSNTATDCAAKLTECHRVMVSSSLDYALFFAENARTLAGRCRDRIEGIIE